MTTSFKKKTSTRGRPNLPSGTKPSLHNNQLLVSTGVPSLDSLLGGGLAVGSLLLIEEDLYGGYANVLQRLFMAEGVINNHDLFLASAENPDNILKSIPTTGTTENESTVGSNKDDLRIAWRYQNKGRVQSGISSSQLGHYFDLSLTISEDQLGNVRCTCFHPDSSIFEKRKSINPYYQNLLRKIQNTIDAQGLSTSSPTINSILRITLYSLGSPLWNESLLNSEKYDSSLAWFLLSLKSMLRKSYACCLVTIPTHLMEDDCYVKRLEHCCDVVVHLESFAGSEKEQNPLYKEYHGLFHVRKQSQLNSIAGQNIDTSDLAFKLKRKKFAIEKLHLPPDISEAVSRSQANTSSLKPGAPLCHATTPVNNLLDF